MRGREWRRGDWPTGRGWEPRLALNVKKKNQKMFTKHIDGNTYLTTEGPRGCQTPFYALQPKTPAFLDLCELSAKLSLIVHLVHLGSYPHRHCPEVLVRLVSEIQSFGI